MSITLIAETGRTAGSRPSGRLREDGRIPAVVYGLGRDAQSVTVPWSDLRRALSTDAGVNALISLEVDGRTDLAIVKVDATGLPAATCRSRSPVSPPPSRVVAASSTSRSRPSP